MFSSRFTKERTRIGCLLVKKGLITQDQLDQTVQLYDRRPLGQVLIDKQLITQEQLRRSLRKQSLLRVFAVITAILLSPFHLSHAQSSPAEEKKSGKSALHLAKAETSINIDSIHKHVKNRTELKDQIDQSLAPEWDLYDGLLLDYAKAGQLKGQDVTLVNFKKLKGDPRFQTLLRNIAEYPLYKLETIEQELAFYINAYNILAMDMVSRNWPIKRLKDLGNMFSPVWTHKAGVIGGHEVTLRELEHAILRKMGEPRVHFAINCASISCPNLRLEAYRSELIYQQLNDQTKQFLNAEKGVHQKGKKTYISKIFKWFKEDFDVMGGVETFILKYRPDVKGTINNASYRLYDWNVTTKLSRTDMRRLKS